MTYADLIVALETAAGWARSIAAGDIRALDDEKGALYPCFGWQSGGVTVAAGGDTMEAAFTLFYVEREVRGGANAVPVQSVGIGALWDTVAAVCGALGAEVPRMTFTPFRETLADECCGVWCDVAFGIVRDTVCDTGDWSEYGEGDGDTGKVVKKYFKKNY